MAQPDAKDKLLTIGDIEYYHGCLRRVDAEKLLKKPGQFLLRAECAVDESEPRSKGAPPKIIRQLIIVIRLSEKKTVEFSVRQDKHGYFNVTKHAFSSIRELVTHYRDVPLDSKDQRTKLDQPLKREPWDILSDDVDVKEKVADGLYGEVRRGRLRRGRKWDNVAVKVGDLPGELNDIKQMLTEENVMQKHEHPHILQVFGIVFGYDKNRFLLVLEWADGSPLHKVLIKARDNKKPYSAREKMDNMMLPVAWGLEYLHSKGCLQPDLGARNVFYDPKTTKLKLVDFGMSRTGLCYQMTNDLEPMPVRWMAPELFAEDGPTFTKESDVFAFGILTYELFSDGQPPFPELTEREVRAMVSRSIRLRYADSTPKELAGYMLDNVICFDAENRRGIDRICLDLEKLRGLKPCRENVLARNTPVVIFHGLFSNASFFDALRETFRSHGYTDEEIYGTTYGPKGRNIGPLDTLHCDYVMQVRAFIMFVSNYTKQPVYVIGNSLGGAITRKAILGGNCVDTGIDIGRQISDAVAAYLVVAGAMRGSMACSTIDRATAVIQLVTGKKQDHICSAVAGVNPQSAFIRDVDKRAEARREAERVIVIGSSDDDAVCWYGYGRYYMMPAYDVHRKIQLSNMNHEDSMFTTQELQYNLLVNDAITPPPLRVKRDDAAELAEKVRELTLGTWNNVNAHACNEYTNVMPLIPAGLADLAEELRKKKQIVTTTAPPKTTTNSHA